MNEAYLFSGADWNFQNQRIKLDYYWKFASLRKGVESTPSRSTFCQEAFPEAIYSAHLMPLYDGDSNSSKEFGGSALTAAPKHLGRGSRRTLLPYSHVLESERDR